MSRILYQGVWYEGRTGETALDTLLRHGQSPPFSCRSGVCLACAQRCPRGTRHEASQRALRVSLRRAGYVLPCKLVPTDDIELAPPREADFFTSAVVQDKQLLAADVCRLLLEPFTTVDHRAGQFINLRRPDGLLRSYSLASVAAEDPYLELHVKRTPGGAMTTWIFDELAAGDEVEIQGPNGSCCYPAGIPDQDMLLVGNGTGAAPLLGIVREALQAGHRGRIVLYHGSRSAEGLYLDADLTRLAAARPRLEYVPCLSGDGAPHRAARGRAHVVAAERHADLRGWRVFVAGHPDMVAEVQAWAVGAGAAPGEIHADPHGVLAERPGPAPRQPVPAADPAMWLALGEGRLLREILTDFYTRVFDDAELAPYFRGVAKERLIGQVFSFMRDWLTGEKRYFGMQPRAAHHWMVISDAIFDHRARLMDECVRRHGVPERFTQIWRRFEESFRAEVVKATPRKLVVDGVELPLEGFGEVELSVGTMCDGCQRAVEVGERVRYHLRIGLTYCTVCSPAAP